MILTQDKAGNQIYIKDKFVYLYLSAKLQTRRLGAINLGNFFVTKRPEHIFRKLNAYGFNYELIKSLKPDAKVVVKQIGEGVIKTTAHDILTRGQILNYLRDGFETQIFMPIDYFKHD